MKKKKMFFGISLLVVAVSVLVCIIIAIIVSNVKNNKNASVFYKEPVLNTLAEVKINVSEADEEKIIDDMLKQVKSVPKNSDLVSALNEDVVFLDYIYDKDKKSIMVNLSPSYYNLSNTDALFSRLAVVWTLTSLDFINEVYFTVNDEVLLNSSGEEFGAMNRSNTVINHSIQPYNTEKRTIKLYFSERNGIGLIAETRDIEVKQNISLEYQIVEQLISGPDNKRCTSVIPKDTKIRNIETKEGTCYVDLSSDFVPSGAEVSNETFIVYSIVNSLTELNYISKVQFLIEGKKIDTFKNLPDFSKTYERDEKYIVIAEEEIENETEFEETTEITEEYGYEQS